MRRFSIDGTEGDSLFMPGKKNAWAVHQTDDDIAGVGQGDPVTHAGAVQFFPFDQGFVKQLLAFKILGHLRQVLHHLFQDLLTAVPREIQFDGVRGDDFRDDEVRGLVHGGTLAAAVTGSRQFGLLLITVEHGDFLSDFTAQPGAERFDFIHCIQNDLVFESL